LEHPVAETITAEDRPASLLPPLTENSLTDRAKRIVRRAYSSGPDMGWKGSSKVVAYAIRVRAECKVGDREFSADINLHEAVLLRRFYEESGGGTVRITPEWVPLLNRLVPLSQEQLKAELDRMNTNFVVPRTNGVFSVPSVFLGNEPAEQLKRLHDVLRRQLDAWTGAVDVAMARLGASKPADPDIAIAAAFEAITGKELEDIANIADPSRDGAGELELPEAAPLVKAIQAFEADPQMTPEQAMQMVAAEGEAEDAQQATVKRLGDAGLDQQHALAVATLAELCGDGQIPDDELADAAGTKAKAKLEAIRRALKG
jgi:hypothetical protein